MDVTSIFGQIGDFFAGLGDVFGGLKKAVEVVLKWAGVETGE